MPWIPVVPENQGGGRKQKTPSAKLYDTGQFVLTHAAVALLGEPPKVGVQINPDERAIRMTPTTPIERRAHLLPGAGKRLPGHHRRHARQRLECIGKGTLSAVH